MQQESETWMDGDGLFSIAPAFLLSNRSTAWTPAAPKAY